jgi:hypothetical protein
MVQTRFNKKNAGLDNILKIFQVVVAVGCTVARLCFVCSTERENIVKAACCVCPTTYCQNAAEMDSMLMQGVVYSAPPTGVVGELPVHFENAGIRVANAPVQHQMV